MTLTEDSAMAAAAPGEALSHGGAKKWLSG